MTRRISALRVKYFNKLTLQRPKQIQEASWRAFQAVVCEGKTVQELSRETGLSVFKLNHMLLRVDRELDPDQNSSEEAGQITLDSPLEELNLSTRARNTLRKIGCDTVRSILRKDFTRAVRSFGAATREEVALVLVTHGFTPPPALDGLQSNVEAVAREVVKLRQHLEQTQRSSLDQLARLEDSVRKLSIGSPQVSADNEKGLCVPRARKLSRSARGNGTAAEALEV